MLRCPICKKDVAPRLENPAFPFCTERCKLIDLGAWLTEKHAIPGEAAADDEAAHGGAGRHPEGDAPSQRRPT